MKTYIFYVSENTAPDRQRLELPGPFKNIVVENASAYVRVEAFDGDCLSALDKATPRDDESVMNTHTL